MKRLIQKTRGVIRGTSSAVLLSAGFHIILLLIASTVVVVKIVQRQDAKFTPAQVNRPKMDLKKLRVKVKDSSKPRKAVERIVSSRARSSMPDIKLPAMTGMGAGVEKGIGGFDMMNDLSKMTMFGGSRSLGNDLEGTLYSLAADRSGNPIAGNYPTDGQITENYVKVVNRFLENNWSAKTLDPFWRSPTKLYASFFMMPPFVSSLATEKFGVPPNTIAAVYLIHYKGKIANKNGGKFRFWGTADDLVFIRINGQLVFDGRPAHGAHATSWKTPENWKSRDPENYKYSLGMSSVAIGDWFELMPGVPVEMEVVFGEDQGGRTACMLNIQQFGVEYPKNREGMPILPAFKTAPIPDHLIDEIQYTLIEGESDLTNGPVFNAY